MSFVNPGIPTQISFFRRHPAALLLAVQILGLIMLPSLHDVFASRIALAVFSVISMLVAVVVVIRSQAVNAVAILLGVLALGTTLASLFPPYRFLLAYGMLFEGLLYLYTAGVLVYYMLSDHHVTLDEMFAAGATFTLLGWAFTYAYIALQHFDPQAFTGLREPGTPRTWIELAFLSFTNLSATGIGDILPISPYARLLAIFEQIFGVGYLGVIVSRFLSLTMHGITSDAREHGSNSQNATTNTTPEQRR